MRRFFRRGRAASDVDHRLRDAVHEMRPLLPIHASTLELDRFDEATGVARLRVRGDCPDCDLRATDLVSGIEARLRLVVPELRGIEIVETSDDG